MIATFAGKVFEASQKKILTPGGRQRTVSANYADHTLLGYKGNKEYLYPELQQQTFTVELKAQFGVNPDQEIFDWEQIVEQGVESPFIWGGRQVGWLWVATEISVTDKTTLSNGKTVEAALDVTLSESSGNPALIPAPQIPDTASEPITSQAPQPEPSPPPPEPSTYTVKSGDTLWAIARENGISLVSLEAANPQIVNPNLIYPGNIVTIPTA